MGNPYAAQFVEKNGKVRLDGELDFTDPANRPGGLLVASVTLAHADILALGSTPVDVVAAQGAGTIIAPVAALFHAHLVADYSGLGDVIYLALDALGNFSVVAAPVTSSGLLDQVIGGAEHFALTSGAGLVVAATPVTFPQSATGPASAAALGYENSPLSVAAGSGGYGGGNAANTLKVTVHYTVIEL